MAAFGKVKRQLSSSNTDRLIHEAYDVYYLAINIKSLRIPWLAPSYYLHHHFLSVKQRAEWGLDVAVEDNTISYYFGGEQKTAFFNFALLCHCFQLAPTETQNPTFFFQFCTKNSLMQKYHGAMQTITKVFGERGQVEERHYISPSQQF